MFDVDVDGEVSGPGSMSRVRIKCSVKCTGCIGIHL